MQQKYDVIVVGAGMAGLTAAALAVKQGLRTLVLEQNWLPGGCSGSYPRLKNKTPYIFESGATTLIGLDKGMPLHYLLQQTQIEIPTVQLQVPMKVHLPDGQLLTRYQELEDWIKEAERVFGKQGQRSFWESCYVMSQKVWAQALQQRYFPPTSWKDLIKTTTHFRFSQLPLLFKSSISMAKVLQKHKLDKNELFRKFIDAQLLITAQNTIEEVSFPFGAAALSYTNYGNYYVNGGLLKMIEPIVEYIENKSGEVKLRTAVTSILPQNNQYLVRTNSGNYSSPYLFAAIPLNNVAKLWEGKLPSRVTRKILPKEKLWGAFTMGVAYHRHRTESCIHHQIHLSKPLPGLASQSIFVSLSKEEDEGRCPKGQAIASISAHVNLGLDPEAFPKEELMQQILAILYEKDFLKPKNLIFAHGSTPGAWEKWTKREYGFVGGYPQYRSIKPWQMPDARIDRKGAYLCGDSSYPGQGIPGVCLSGIIAFEKFKTDYL